LKIFKFINFSFSILLFVGTSPHTPTYFGAPKKQKDCIFTQNNSIILHLIHILKILRLVYAFLQSVPVAATLANPAECELQKS
ncbi:hypothetical protein R4K89_14305, partial [Brachyspira intermedia]|uniref:hypothetical protein n=1 Tax=Brachyspira intermedia TaxID=84377 RepID=UPI00300403A2